MRLPAIARHTLIASACALCLGSACAKGSQPTTTVSHDGGATEIAPSCAAIEARVKSLYEEAAEQEGIAMNLRSEFVSANLHMVMKDCRLSPANRTSCLREAKSVEAVEGTCLEYLDDQGTVEGHQFAGAVQ